MEQKSRNEKSLWTKKANLASSNKMVCRKLHQNVQLSFNFWINKLFCCFLFVCRNVCFKNITKISCIMYIYFQNLKWLYKIFSFHKSLVKTKLKQRKNNMIWKKPQWKNLRSIKTFQRIWDFIWVLTTVFLQL